MTPQERRKQAKAAFQTDPAPTKRGGSAGTRAQEGLLFQSTLRDLLARPGFVIETALGKSSDGNKLDGNASERISYKMLRFKRNPLNRSRTLVLALNAAFEKYDNPQIHEFKEQAGYLNGLDSRASVIILSRWADYDDYLSDLEAELGTSP
jgi:hypothetical protein